MTRCTPCSETLSCDRHPDHSRRLHIDRIKNIHPSVCLFPAKDQARGDHPFTVFFSDHIRLRGIYDGRCLEIEYSLPFGFDCFRKLRLLFGRKVFPGYHIGVPSAEVKFSMQCLRLGRRNRKGSMLLASSVEVSSLLPYFSVCSSFFHLWWASIVRVGHFASSFCGLPKVLPRSCSGRVALQLGYHLQQPCSPVVARTSLLRKKEKGQRIHLSQLVSAFSPRGSSIRGYVQMMSR